MSPIGPTFIDITNVMLDILEEFNTHSTNYYKTKTKKNMVPPLAPLFHHPRT